MAKLTKEDKELVKEVFDLWKKRYISKRHSVSSVLISNSGQYYKGMSMEFDCGLSFCAERAAMSAMCCNGESKIKTIVAAYDRKIIPPCGVCRESMLQINKDGMNTWVIISKNKKVKLRNLYPMDWRKAF